jgi:hypothetical protein
LIDAMSIPDDAARRCLPEYLRQTHHRHGARVDNIGQYLTRSDRRQLVDIPDQQQSGSAR